MDQSTKNTKPLVSIDWTGTEGDTPFYEQSSSTHVARYGVAIDTQVVQWSELTERYGTPYTNSDVLLTSGTIKILDFYNKEHRSVTDVRTYIPSGPSGTFVPHRPGGTIKVLVTIPDIYVDPIPERQPVIGGAYDEIHLNTFNFTQKAQNISKLLKKYNKRAKNFEGRIYDFNFEQQADKVANFASSLVELVNSNKVPFSEDGSDLIIIGADSQYAPLYAQINLGGGFGTLTTGFTQFKQSKFVDSNTMFIYNHFEEINKIAINAGATSPATKTSVEFDWQNFLDNYIKFPQAVIEYTSGRPNTPEPDEDLKKATAAANNASMISTADLQRQEARLKSKEFQTAMMAKQKASREWIGDNVLGNLDKIVTKLDTLESMYHDVLDKTGMTYIVRAAIRCLAVDLPLSDLKEVLGDIRVFTAGVLEILKIPVIDLDDIFPTVDIMGDIIEQVFWAIYEAVKKALWGMLKQIIYSLLDNCDDPCQAGFGGINLGALLSKPPLEALGALAGPALAVAGDAAAQGLNTGLKSADLNSNSKKFLNNLNKKISSEQMETLVAPVKGVAGQATSAAKSAISNSAIGKFFEKCSENLTCGETNKLLEGKASPAAIKIIRTLAANDPILKELLGDQDSINDFFGSAGKLIDEDELQAQIDALSEIYPDPCGNLSDRRDSELRCELLKEKGVPPEFCDEQEGASRERALERIKQLQKFLEDPDQALQDAIPPIYCTYKDGKIVQGLVSNDHPSFSFMLKTTLDTSLDGIYNAFTYDVLRLPDVMQQEVPDEDEEIKRVIDALPHQVGNNKPARLVRGKWRMINPIFEMAVEQGYKPFPPFWKCPPIYVDDDGDNIIEDYLEKTIEYNLKVQGLSPYKKPTTKVVYSPGMSGPNGVYGGFQTGYEWRNNEGLNEVARRRLSVDRNSLQLSIANSIKTDLQKYGPSEEGGLLKTIVDSAQNDPAFAAAVSDLGLDNLFGPERYVVSLTAFSQTPSDKDKFVVRITGDSASGPDAQIYRKMFELDIPEAANKIIVTGGLDLDLPPELVSEVSNKENRFVQFLQNIWSQGENIYSGSVNDLQKVVASEYPTSNLDYCRRFAPTSTNPLGFSTQTNNNSTGVIATALLQDQDDTKDIKSLYEELLRDLMASTLTQVSTSPLLDEQFSDLFSLINFAPIPREGCPDLSLLGLEIIKDDILERYKDAQCIEKTFPNVSGLGDNRDNAFESAALFGIVKATVRTYALEVVLKTLPTFSALQAKDLDDVFIVYLREHMTGEINGKGYLDDFMGQTLKAYNLFAASVEAQGLGLKQTDEFNVAVDYFIREEMKYSVQKVLAIAGLTNPQKSINNLLIQNGDEGWLPDIEPGWGLGNNLRLQSAYHVESVTDLLGIKDPINGSFVVEKYIRAETRDNWVDSIRALDSCGVYSVIEFADLMMELQSRYPTLAAPNPEDGNVIIENTLTVVGDDCGPEGTLVVGDPATSPPTHPNRIGKFFKSVRYGLRLVCKSGNNESLNQAMRLPSPYPPAGSEAPNFYFNKAKVNQSYLISDSPNVSNAATGFPDYNRFVFPVVCVERDINPDTLVPDTGFAFLTTGYEKEFAQLLCMLKGTDEYKFMFDYCFPLKRLVSLAVLYNTAYVLPFAGLNNVFVNTKEQLRMTFGAMLNSGNYQYKDPQANQRNQALNIANGKEMTGFDFALMALQFLFGLMKGAGEAFSPNIAIARKIQILTEMIGPGLVKSINKAKEVGNKINRATSAHTRSGRETPDAFDPITECDLPPPFPLPEIPIILISLGLVPMDLFFPVPGPPLGPLGFMYLQLFHSEIAIGRLILGMSEDEKEKKRCAIKDLGAGVGINILTNQPDDCPAELISQPIVDECAWGFDPITGEPLPPPISPSGEQGAGGSPSLDPSGDDDDTALPDIGRSTASKIPHDCD
jgi:hypothetical protein